MFDILKNPLWRIDYSTPLDQARLNTIRRFREIHNLIGRNDHTDNYQRMFALL